MILITGFKRFAGRRRNGSETLARFLAGSVVGGEPVRSEILDVLWGAPEENLPGWIADARPVLVLGLGEGAGDALRFETLAANRASGTDEGGNAPRCGSAPTPGGSGSLRSTMRFDPAWVADLVHAESSEDAGAFLCNAWLYCALQLSPCPTAFIHLPVQGETPDDEYGERWAPAIREILLRNLPE